MEKKLTPTKQKGTHKKVFGFDVETISDKNIFYMGSLVRDKEVYVFYNKEDFVKSFFKINSLRNSIIVATNLEFDFQSIFKDTKELKYFKLGYHAGRMLSAKVFYDKDGNLYSKKPQKIKTFSLEFLDTLNYIKMSVKGLGNFLKIPKLPHPKCFTRKPKNDEEKKELEKYNIRDSLISQKALEFIKESFEKLGATFKTTIASTSMSLFRNKYLKEEFPLLDKEILKFHFKSYFGGRTEVFQRGLFKQHIGNDGKLKTPRLYDFCSLYPSVMVEEVPDTRTLIKFKFGNVENIKKYKFGVSDVEIYMPYSKIPLLPNRDQKPAGLTSTKLRFMNGNIKGTYTHLELQKALEIGGKILKVKEQHVFTKGINLFEEYVKDLYELRKKLKKEKSPIEFVVKLFLNSLTGKFGQKFWDLENFQPLTENFNFNDLKVGEEFERIGNYIRTKGIEQSPAVFCFPIWISYITARGRLKLYDVLTEEGVDPLYCDTDSIITFKELPSGIELGQLELEQTIIQGIIIRPKQYYYVSKEKGTNVKVKGVPIHSIKDKEPLEIFIDVINSKKLEYDKFLKLRESLRRHKQVNEKVPASKVLSLDDDKRIFNGEFNYRVLQDSEPYHL